MPTARPSNRPIRQLVRSLTDMGSRQYRHMSAPASPQDSSNVALGLVFDFDGTITEDDSIVSVVDAALSRHKDGSSPGTWQSLTDAWQNAVKSYMADLDAYERNMVPTVHTTPLDVARAHFSNNQRRQIEQASLLRVQDAGIFRGVSQEYLFRCAQEQREEGVVKLRSGFSDLIHLIRSPSVIEESASVHVLSVNWSAAYIRGALSREEISMVIANEINPADGSINATPALSTDIASVEWPSVLTVGSDKLSALRCLHRQQQKAKPELSVEFVYFGDSITDLECLLEFGGIVISPKAEIEQGPSTKTAKSYSTAVKRSELLHMLQTRLHYNVPHVSQYKDELICWARDFAEVIHSRFLQTRAAHVRPTKT